MDATQLHWLSAADAARAVREGAILYLDEFAEARSDVVVVIHPLSDHRRRLYIERTDEEIEATRRAVTRPYTYRSGASARARRAGSSASN